MIIYFELRRHEKRGGGGAEGKHNIWLRVSTILADCKVNERKQLKEQTHQNILNRNSEIPRIQKAVLYLKVSLSIHNSGQKGECEFKVACSKTKIDARAHAVEIKIRK